MRIPRRPCGDHKMLDGDHKTLPSQTCCEQEKQPALCALAVARWSSWRGLEEFVSQELFT